MQPGSVRPPGRAWGIGEYSGSIGSAAGRLWVSGGRAGAQGQPPGSVAKGLCSGGGGPGLPSSASGGGRGGARGTQQSHSPAGARGAQGGGRRRGEGGRRGGEPGGGRRLPPHSPGHRRSAGRRLLGLAARRRTPRARLMSPSAAGEVCAQPGCLRAAFPWPAKNHGGWARINCIFQRIPQKSHRQHTGHLDAVSQKKSMRNWQQRSHLTSKWNTDYKD